MRGLATSCHHLSNADTERQINLQSETTESVQILILEYLVSSCLLSIHSIFTEDNYTAVQNKVGKQQRKII